MDNSSNTKEYSQKVLSLREYKERNRLRIKPLESGTSTNGIKIDRLTQLIESELAARDQIIKDIVVDYNRQIDNLTSRQDSLLQIIKELIKKIDKTD